jgi:hypothetical protein
MAGTSCYMNVAARAIRVPFEEVVKGVIKLLD